MPEVRRLTADEWSLLDKVQEPFTPDPNKSIAVIAQNDCGDIVARGFLVAPAHVEGMWIDQASRNKTLFYRLMRKLEEEGKREGLTKILVFAPTPEIADYVQRMGYAYAPVSVWSKELI